MTRRVIEYIPDLGDPDRWCHKLESVNAFCGDFRRYCPFGKPGDKLWVRETWAVEPSQDDKRAKPPSNHIHGEELCFYKATLESWQRRGKWRPSIHMPRWASRITLEVTDVHVERVREISIDDIRAEGIVIYPFDPDSTDRQPDPWEIFADLWNSINEKRGFGWDENPWVWVVEFKKGQPNDQR
jgi:hypothetical protein